MDKSIAHIQEKVPGVMLFADDIMFMDKLKDDVNAKLKKCHRGWGQS